MTPKEQKELTRAIQANRRTLSLLDRRMDDLLKTHPSLLADYDIEDRQPFFYAAVGSDGKAGIPVSVDNRDENPAFGYVRSHPDSAFVLTNLTSAREIIYDTPFVFFGSGSEVNRSQGFGLRMYDESSSRWITFTNFNGEPQQKTKFPSVAFMPYIQFSEGGFSMPAECVFPRSAVIRVEAYVEFTEAAESFFDQATYRLHVVFGGYKVFGG